jgi:hypothetical protein
MFLVFLCFVVNGVCLNFVGPIAVDGGSRRNQAVCQEQLGAAHIGKGECQSAGFAVIDMNIVTVDANNIATDIFAAIHWFGQLNLNLMACPVGKIRKAG